MIHLYTDILPENSGVISKVDDIEEIVHKVNGHIHTPYSFSAFAGVAQAFAMADNENIRVLGINDFYTTDGYDEFAQLARAYGIFPLFNIEFMALQKDAREAGSRINDPQNPGRTYLSGKGLRYPVSMSTDSRERMRILQVESNRQTYLMVEKLNRFLETTSTGLYFNPAELQAWLARNLFRERHIAAAVRMALFEKFQTEALILQALTEIFSGKVPISPLTDAASLENEIRNNLLKVGGPAFVEEDEKAFLSLPDVVAIIRDAGGIPCYPVLLDDAKGNLTSFERDFSLMAELLKDQKIWMVELIPGRNDHAVLLDFVRVFNKHGFVITFGTEHNTPKLDPLTVSCRDNVPLGEELEAINYRGACIIAAHQYLVSRNLPGFPDAAFPSGEQLDSLASTGNKVISTFIQRSK